MIHRPPDRLDAVTENGPLPLNPAADGWAGGGVQVSVSPKLGIDVTSDSALVSLRLRWDQPPAAHAVYLGDHWERGYGDLQWRAVDAARVMPWYFLGTGKAGTFGAGVKTGAAAIAAWQVDRDGVTLHLDLRSGGAGVRLGSRRLHAADIVADASSEPAFPFARRFCGQLCDRPLMPPQPVYGGNNWYYAYGHSSHQEMVNDARLMASLAPGGENRPFMVIDDGWQVEHGPFNGGPWDRGNARFPDMAKLAADMRDAGARPGLWFRPLFTRANVPGNWTFEATRFDGLFKDPVLDPSIPDVLEHVAADVRRFADWGYELIKHDFSTYDLFGRWGFEMAGQMTTDGWRFADGGRTTAEIVTGLYRAIHEAAGGRAMVLGCNTIGHLAAGLVELQRTGDDTSGQEWARTRKMGVNTLAFRMPQHGAFFAVDADCVGLTDKVPWELNRQWLDLLARSGTPLFVSADPNAVGPQQRAALQEAFQLAAVQQPIAEPLDWQETLTPAKWRTGPAVKTYAW